MAATCGRLCASKQKNKYCKLLAIARFGLSKAITENVFMVMYVHTMKKPIK